MHLLLCHLVHGLLDLKLDVLKLRSELLGLWRLGWDVEELVLGLLVLDLKDHQLLLEGGVWRRARVGRLIRF